MYKLIREYCSTLYIGIAMVILPYIDTNILYNYMLYELYKHVHVYTCTCIYMYIYYIHVYMYVRTIIQLISRGTYMYGV